MGIASGKAVPFSRRPWLGNDLTVSHQQATLPDPNPPLSPTSLPTCATFLNIFQPLIPFHAPEMWQSLSCFGPKELAVSLWVKFFSSSWSSHGWFHLSIQVSRPKSHLLKEGFLDYPKYTSTASISITEPVYFPCNIYYHLRSPWTFVCMLVHCLAPLPTGDYRIFSYGERCRVFSSLQPSP